MTEPLETREPLESASASEPPEPPKPPGQSDSPEHPESPERPIAKLARLPRKVWISIIAGLAILIVLPLALIQLQRQLFSATDDAKSAQSDASSDAGQPNPETKQPAPTVTESTPPVDAVSLQQRALQEAKVLRVRQQGERIGRQWKELSAAQYRLAMSLETLQSDEAGKRIASSPELIDRYAALQQTALPAAEVTEALQEELAILLKPLDAIAATQIEAEFTSALEELAHRIDAQLIAVQRDQRMLDALQAVAANRAPGALLKNALEQRTRELAEARLTDIANASAAVRQSGIDRVNQENAEQQRNIAEAEREVQRLQAEQRLAELESQQRARQAAIAKAALERDFQRDLSEIRSLLRPLITDGLTQPGRNNFEPADKKGPVSLAKLRGTGALAPTAKARAGLYYIVGTIQDRDLGSFPRYRGGAQDVQSKQATMMRVQELVNKYGELMVEKGLLAE